MEVKDSGQEYVRIIHRTPQFEVFYESLPTRIVGKVDYVLDVIATVYNVSSKFIKHLENTDLYEMRISVGSSEYRTVIFAIDHPNFIQAKNILLLNGFLKKDNKDYKKQIDIARRILKQYEL